MLFDEKNDKAINLDDFRKEKKRRERKEKLEQGLKKLKDEVIENKETVLFLVSSGVAAGGKIHKEISKHKKIQKEQDLKDLYCYDRSLGHYWQLKRKLTNREWQEISTRKKRGENLGDILNNMRVLK